MSDSKDDIPFEDSPPRPERDVTAERSANDAAGADGGRDGNGKTDAGAGAHRDGPAKETGAGGASASEGRTSSGPGSTGPSGVREDLGTLGDEARKLWSAIEARVVAPAVQSYPEVARHLGAAGREVAAAVRSVVRGAEQSWQTGGSGGDSDRQPQKITVERVDRIDPTEQKNRD